MIQCLLKDENGEFIPSIKTLNQYLNSEEITSQQSRIRTTKVQVFQGSINMQFPEMMAIAKGSSFKINISSKDLMDEYKNGIGEYTHEGFGQFIIEPLSNETKKEALYKLLSENAPIENGSSGDLAINSENELEKSIATSREIKKANLDGNNDASKLHKNSTKKMLDLCREIQYQLNNTNNFLEALNNAIKKEMKSACYSIKVINELIDIFKIKDETGDNKLSNRRKKFQKGNDKKFPTEFSNKLSEKIIEKVEKYKSDEAKLEYLKAYFNKTKIMNRND
jgi:hypothetical protein